MKDNTSCCSVSATPAKDDASNICPVCASKDKKLKLITLKSLLKPKSLATIDAQQQYYFCKDANCETVYFNNKGQIFTTDNIKVRVHQKDSALDVSVCYCFDWTPKNIAQAAKEGRLEQIAPSISAHIKAGRCGCEVNNPQGSCCLGNVNSVIQQFQN